MDKKPERQLSSEEYKEYCSNYIPIGVWICWAIIVLLGVGLLGSRFEAFSKAITFFIIVITPLAATGAAVAAYLTVKELRNERQEERHNRRPYFSFVEGEIGTAPDDEAQYGTSEYITLILRQVGINPASDLTVNATLLMDLDEGFSNEEVIHRAVNDIASGFDYPITQGGLNIDASQHHYVVLELDYYDAIYGVRFPPQKFYLQWSGLDTFDATHTSSPLYTITREVKPMLSNMLRQL